MWISLYELLMLLKFSTSEIGDWWEEKGHILKSDFYALFSALSNFSVLLVTTSKEICDNYSLSVFSAKSLMSNQIRHTIFYVWNVSGSLFIRPSLYNFPSPPLIKYHVSMPFCNADFKVLDLLKLGQSFCISHKKISFLI